MEALVNLKNLEKYPWLTTVMVKNIPWQDVHTNAKLKVRSQSFDPFLREADQHTQEIVLKLIGRVEVDSATKSTALVSYTNGKRVTAPALNDACTFLIELKLVDTLSWLFLGKEFSYVTPALPAQKTDALAQLVGCFVSQLLDLLHFIQKKPNWLCVAIQ